MSSGFAGWWDHGDDPAVLDDVVWVEMPSGLTGRIRAVEHGTHIIEVQC